MTDNNNITENQTDKTIYVNEQTCKFFISTDGFASCKLGDETFENVIISRALPFTAPDKYICIIKDEKEIAMIKNLSDYSNEQQEIIKKELEFRYFTPVITKIYSIEENVSFLFMKLDTTAGKKEICVTDIAKNFTLLEEDKLFITDVEENRFRIDSIAALDKASKQKLEIFV